MRALADRGVGDAVNVGRDAEQHGAPALGADRRACRRAEVRPGAAGEDAVDIRRICPAEKVSGAVHADENDGVVIAWCHGCDLLGDKKPRRKTGAGRRFIAED